MDDGRQGSFRDVFDTNKNPSILNFLAKGLIPGLPYWFWVQAYNFNGKSDYSSVMTIYSCEDIKGINSPKYLSSTSTSLTVQWEEPANIGGCSITGYELYMDGVEVNSALVWNKPSIRQSTITMNTLDLGTSFTFKLVVNNINFVPMNSYESEDEIILFAIVPEKPASVTEVTSLTTGS